MQRITFRSHCAMCSSTIISRARLKKRLFMQSWKVRFFTEYIVLNILKNNLIFRTRYNIFFDIIYDGENMYGLLKWLSHDFTGLYKTVSIMIYNHKYSNNSNKLYLCRYLMQKVDKINYLYRQARCVCIHAYWFGQVSVLPATCCCQWQSYYCFFTIASSDEGKIKIYLIFIEQIKTH